MRNALLQSGVFVVLCLFAAGCSSSKTVDVAGEVTFDGRPVPAGRIYFNPDFTKGNDGPQGFAPIINGKFDTRKDGRGACGGPTVVVIHGHAGSNEPNNIGDPIFNEHHIPIDLPREASTQKFDVPKSAADKLKKSRGEKQN